MGSFEKTIAVSEPPELALTETVTVSLENVKEIVRIHVADRMNWVPSQVQIISDARADQLFTVSRTRVISR